MDQTVKEAHFCTGNPLQEWAFKVQGKSDGKQTEEVYTFEEIADILSGQQGYNGNLNEKTVRNYKNALVRDMAILLFGSDAV